MNILKKLTHYLFLLIFQRNEELERENKKLAEEKQNLERRAQTFNRIIEKHIEMGCKVPSNVQDMLQGISSHSSSDEYEAFRAVGTIERDHTPPHTPESSSSGKLSPHLPFTYSDFPECHSVAPTALFSGTLLSESDLSRKRNPSTSRSSSSSPAPSPSVSPVQAVPQTLGKQKDLSYFLGSDSLPDVLTPLRPKGKQNHVQQFVYSSGQAVPTVVSEIEETSKEYMPRTFDTIDRGINNIHTSDVIATALQLPDVPAQDEVAMKLSIGDQIPQDDETNQNLSSMGFNCVDQYSFSEDLHQMESVQEICVGEYSSNIQQSTQQLTASDKQDRGHLQGRFETHPVVSVSVSACAPALLDMCPEMSESLQQQIKMSYVSSSDSVSGAVSGSAQPRQNVDVSQQNVVTRPVQVLKQPLLPQQQLNAVKGQQWTADGQLVQVLTSHKEGQATNKEVQVVVSPAKVSLMQKQLKDTHEPYQSQEAHRLQRQLSGQIQLLTNSPSTRQQVQHTTVTRQMSKELPVHQSMQSCQAAVDIQIPAGNHVRAQPSANKLIIVTAPKDNLFESLTKQSPITFTASSVNPTTPQLTPQHCQTVKQTVSNGYLLPNVQSTRTQSYSILTSCVPQIQNLASESSASTADIDYSVNVQDLPSLNFTELNSDNNLFEKKPSRSSS